MRVGRLRPLAPRLRHRGLPGRGAATRWSGSIPDADGRARAATRAGRRCDEPGLAELRRRRPGARAGSSFTTDAAAALARRGRRSGSPSTRRSTSDDEADRRVRPRAGSRRSRTASARGTPGARLLAGAGRVHARACERDWAGRGLRFACSPENLRLGQAIDVLPTGRSASWSGVRDAARPRRRGRACSRPFTPAIEWMSIESAEMTKHALNAFLADLGHVRQRDGAACARRSAPTRKEVERGLQERARASGPQAYVSPGRARSPAARWPATSRFLAGARRAPAASRRRSLERRAGEQRGARGVAAARRSARAAGRRRDAGGRRARPHLQAGHQHAAPLGVGRAVPLAARRRACACARTIPAVRGAAARSSRPSVALPRARAEALDGRRRGGRGHRLAGVPRAAAPTTSSRACAGRCVVDPDRFLAATLGAEPRVAYVATGRADGGSDGELTSRVDLAGRAAIVTGASQGLGRAIADALRARPGRACS